MTRAGVRWVEAGGTLANFLAGGLFFLGRRLTRRGSPHWRYFLWLSMAINLMTGAGYFLFSGVANIGDWAEIVRDLSPRWAWRVGLSVAGAILYVGCVRLALGEMAPFIGAGAGRLARAKKLALVPYLAGGILSCVAGLLNPVGMALVAISAAAASFGGTSGLAWMTSWLKDERIARSSEPPLSLDRRWPWIAAGGVCAALFVFYLGPGIRFR